MPQDIAREAVALVVVVAIAGAGSCSVASASPQDRLFRGVNVGGWMVLESWITPSLYAANGVKGGLGEWEFCATVTAAGGACEHVLTPHWDTWVTEDHIEALHQSGITDIRLPLGYWVLGAGFVKDDEPFVKTGAGWTYVERLMTWTATRKMQVLLDLHGAPGSQNGHDNSGHSTGGIQWTTPENQNRTIDVLVELSRRALAINANATTSNVISGIEVLNEPWTTSLAGGTISLPFLQAFYTRAYNSMRDTGWQGDILISDGFQLQDPSWEGFLAPPAANNVYLDTHIYHAFGGPRQASTPWGNVAYTCLHDVPMLAGMTRTDWVITGEWSLATGPATPNTTAGHAYLAAFYAAQGQAYGPGAWGSAVGNHPAKGSYFWNFRIEDSGVGGGRFQEWDYLLGHTTGWIAPGAGSLQTEFDFSCADFALARHA